MKSLDPSGVVAERSGVSISAKPYLENAFLICRVALCLLSIFFCSLSLLRSIYLYLSLTSSFISLPSVCISIGGVLASLRTSIPSISSSMSPFCLSFCIFFSGLGLTFPCTLTTHSLRRVDPTACASFAFGSITPWTLPVISLKSKKISFP